MDQEGEHWSRYLFVIYSTLLGKGHIQVKKRKVTLVYNYPKSPKVNTFVERVSGMVQAEYLDKFYEETSVSKINEILYDCLIEYNFYRHHRSPNLLTPSEYCSNLLNNKDPSMVQMYWAQAKDSF